MKKTLITLAVLGAVGIGSTLFYVQSFDKEQAEQLTATTELTGANQAAMSIFYSNSCQYCHSQNAERPFYTELPLLKDKFAKDIQKGFSVFELDALFVDLHQGTANEAALAKLERVIQRNEMPMKEFQSIHWSSSLDDSEKQLLLDWIHQQRKNFLPQNTQGTDVMHLVQPIPDSIPTEAKKVALGEALYHDVRLSGDNSVSCHTCHQLQNGGVDGLATSTGINGQKGGINAPTVYNAAFNVLQFWDGRAKDLAAQAGGPPLNPVEMGSHSWDEIIAKLEQDEAFKEAFLQSYKEINADTITDAIAEFEKTLITPNSDFDRYLKGDKTVLSEEALRGFKLFETYKCDTCHTGTAMGGQSFEKMGIYDDYFGKRATPRTDADLGRFAHTKDPKDKQKFKVPTLRNVALTAPYFHDANAKDLETAIEMMAHYQVGKDLTKKEVAEIKAFLESLTGEYQGKKLTRELP